MPDAPAPTTAATPERDAQAATPERKALLAAVTGELEQAMSTRTVLLFDFLRPGRTMDEVDELPPEVAAAVRHRTRDQQ